MLFSDGVDHNDKMQPFLTAFYKSFVPTAILLPKNELLQILNKCEGVIGKLVFQLPGVA